jgi:hypothetical protein
MCLTAFVAVFVLLLSLALCIRLIRLLFPERESDNDAVLAAAIATVVASVYNGARVTSIQEES